MVGRSARVAVPAEIFAFLTVMLAGTAVAGGGFDEFGYNYGARVFAGKADGVDRVLDGKV